MISITIKWLINHPITLNCVGQLTAWCKSLWPSLHLCEMPLDYCRMQPNDIPVSVHKLCISSFYNLLHFYFVITICKYYNDTYIHTFPKSNTLFLNINIDSSRQRRTGFALTAKARDTMVQFVAGTNRPVYTDQSIYFILFLFGITTYYHMFCQ